MEELKKRNWLKQSQDKLACIYCDLMWRVWKGEKKEKMVCIYCDFDVKSVKGRKEGKDEEIKGDAIRPFGHRKKEVKSQSVRTRCSLEELHEWEQVKNKKKIERARENT